MGKAVRIDYRKWQAFRFGFFLFSGSQRAGTVKLELHFP